MTRNRYYSWTIQNFVKEYTGYGLENPYSKYLKILHIDVFVPSGIIKTDGLKIACENSPKNTIMERGEMHKARKTCERTSYTNDI